MTPLIGYLNIVYKMSQWMPSYYLWSYYDLMIYVHLPCAKITQYLQLFEISIVREGIIPASLIAVLSTPMLASITYDSSKNS